MDAPKNVDARGNDGDRERLQQELLELHFGCHPDPAPLQARLLREPELQRLQQEALATAALLQSAATPATGPLPLPQPAARTGWWQSRWRRVGHIAAAAALAVAGLAVHHGICTWQNESARSEQCHVVVTGPQAVPAGAPWSFTVESLDLDGNPLPSELRWRVVAADGSELGTGSGSMHGRSVVQMTAGMVVPARVEVTAVHGSRTVEQSLKLEPSVAPPLVHVSTDKPVYRPGEPVYVRAVVLDRCTLQPSPQAVTMVARILDAKGGVVFDAGTIAVGGTGALTAVGASVWAVPADSSGGEHTLELRSWNEAFPTERLPFVVRAYATPRLDTKLVLDRTTYPPGGAGSAEVKVQRLGGGAAAGAAVRGSLVLDGEEVWSGEQALDPSGRAVFRFAVPAVVKAGAARFLARVTDGGVVETAVEPFVVPTGEVLAAAFPEGGELIAGVENRVYVELTDPLGRPVDGVGAIVDGRGAPVAEFMTAHQGRARVAFTPEAGAEYRLRTTGLKEALKLPAVLDRGIALRTADDGIDAGAPVRLHLAGRGDGPWLVGVFCRGVLLGQTRVRAEDGSLDAEVAIDVPAAAAGVLRVTVFDRALRPVAERLVQRRSSQHVQLALQPERAVIAPGDPQKVTVRATDERGQPLAGAAIGLTVTDAGAIAMRTEPRIGLQDQWLLFADVERLEHLDGWLLSAAQSGRNVDLLLGTRGWRRFVWQNDAAAQATLAAAPTWGKDQLLREGFAQRPQTSSNLQTATAAVADYQSAADRSGRWLRTGASAALALLGLWLVVEGWLWLSSRLPLLVRVTASLGAVAALALLLVPSLGSSLAPAAIQLDAAEAGAAVPVHFGRQAGVGGDPFMPPRIQDLFEGKDNDNLLAWKEGRLGLEAEKMKQVDWRKARPLGGAGGGPGAPGAGGRVPGFAAGGPGREAVGVVGPQGRRDAFLAGRLEQFQALRVYAHQRIAGDARQDFTETICWQPLLMTGADGSVTTSFDTSELVTTWRLSADAHGNGRVGQGEAEFAARLPLQVHCKLPVEASAGDRLLLPLSIERTDGEAAAATVDIAVEGPLVLVGPARREVALTAGRGRELVEVRVGDATGVARVLLHVESGRFRDDIKQSFQVAPRGFPHGSSSGGTVAGERPARIGVNLPAAAVPGSGRVLVRVFPSPLADMVQGLQGILQEPNGCFEQASSSNYPNVMVLSFLEASGDDVPAVAARARELLPRGYAKITGYECKERGYEWFGGDPGHEALTAYGLLQFHDMGKVHAVDAGMVARTQQWLLGRRDGKGGYKRNDRALDSFGRAPQEVTDAYVTYALLHTGTAPAELQREVARLLERAAASADPYELALIAAALHDARHDAAAATRQKLLGLQQKDGSLCSTTTSITSSGGDDLAVETTGLAVIAWLDDPACAGAVQRAVAFLQSKKSAGGTFGATQATVCALKALSAYAQKHRVMQAPGTLRLFAGARQLGERAFAAGQAEPVEFEVWAQLPPGEHELRLELAGEAAQELPWACDVAYHSELPADDPQGAVGVATRLLAAQVEEGRTVGLEVLVQNRRAEGQPMALAVIGLPAGLDLPTSVLDDRKKAGDFDLWELRGRELALYWRSLAPKAERRVQFDLVAAIPGVTTGAASRARLYYTPSQRWASPLRIEVTATPSAKTK